MTGAVSVAGPTSVQAGSADRGETQATSSASGVSAWRRVGRAALRLVVWLIYIAVAIGIWELIIVTSHPAEYVLPSVREVLSYYHQHGSLILKETRTTLVEIVAGFGVGLGAGIFLAILFDIVPVIRRVVWPYLLFLQMLPKVAIAPWMLLLFGFGLESKIVLAAILAFFPVFISSIAGLEAVPEQAEELARSMQMSRLGYYRYIKLPGALPQVFSGAKVGITLAVIGAVVGEFIGGNAGLGYLIVSGQGNADANPIVVGIINLSIMGSLLYGIIELVERFSISWHVSRRRQQAPRASWRSARPSRSADTAEGGAHVVR